METVFIQQSNLLHEGSSLVTDLKTVNWSGWFPNLHVALKNQLKFAN